MRLNKRARMGANGEQSTRVTHPRQAAVRGSLPTAAAVSIAVERRVVSADHFFCQHLHCPTVQPYRRTLGIRRPITLELPRYGPDWRWFFAAMHSIGTYFGGNTPSKNEGVLGERFPGILFWCF